MAGASSRALSGASLEYTDSAQTAAPFRAARRRALGRWQRPRLLVTSPQRGQQCGTPRRDPDPFPAELGETLVARGGRGPSSGRPRSWWRLMRKPSLRWSRSRQVRCPQFGEEDQLCRGKNLKQISDRHAENACSEDQLSLRPCSVGRPRSADDSRGIRVRTTLVDMIPYPGKVGLGGPSLVFAG